eukprot:tig00020603_g11794.t1
MPREGLDTDFGGIQLEELLVDLTELRESAAGLQARAWIRKRGEALKATFELRNVLVNEAKAAEESSVSTLMSGEAKDANAAPGENISGVPVDEYHKIVKMIEAQQARLDELLAERQQSYSELRSMIENFKNLQSYTSAQYDQLRDQFEKMIAEKNAQLKSMKQDFNTTTGGGRSLGAFCAPCAPSDGSSFKFSNLFSCFGFLGPSGPTASSRPPTGRERPGSSGGPTPLQLVGVDRARAVAAMDAMLVASPGARSERELHSVLCTCAACMARVPGRALSPPPSALPAAAPAAPASSSSASAPQPSDAASAAAAAPPPVLPRLFALPGAPSRTGPPEPAPRVAAAEPPPAPTGEDEEEEWRGGDGDGDGGDKSSDSLEGVDPYFTKPLDVSLLITKLQAVSSASASPTNDPAPASAEPASSSASAAGPAKERRQAAAPGAAAAASSASSSSRKGAVSPSPRKRVPAGGHRLKAPAAAGGAKPERPSSGRARAGAGAGAVGTTQPIAPAAAGAGASDGTGTKRGKFVVTL